MMDDSQKPNRRFTLRELFGYISVFAIDLAVFLGLAAIPPPLAVFGLVMVLIATGVLGALIGGGVVGCIGGRKYFWRGAAVGSATLLLVAFIWLAVIVYQTAS